MGKKKSSQTNEVDKYLQLTKEAQAKFGNKKDEENLNKIKVDEPLSLDFITNPNKDK